jgi:hypothetical protein
MAVSQQRASSPVVLLAHGSFVSLSRDGFYRQRTVATDHLRDITSRYRKPNVADAMLLSLGQELYSWLDGDEGWLRELFPQLDAPFILEVRADRPFDESAATVLQAPWELLADMNGFLASDATLSFAPARRVGESANLPADEYQLGVVFMASAPRGEYELDYEAEESAILEATPDLDLLVEESGDPKELSPRLRSLESGLPQVVHLSCHGADQWPPQSATPGPALLMEDEYGNQRPTPTDDLVNVFRNNRRPRVLFLSACSSAAGTSDVLTDSLASALVGSSDFPAVLGWGGPVYDVAATTFARDFYECLAKRWTVAEAAAIARRKLLNGPAAGESAIPDTAQRANMKRNWHLARLWLGPSPPGGGAVVGGTTKRLLLPRSHASKKVLAEKSDANLEVCNPAMFVGRRREMQRALQALRGDQDVGVLLHGMGRSGKSSLAARVADRRPDLRFVVVFGDYDARSILDALLTALVELEPALDLIAKHRTDVLEDAEQLYSLMVDLLSGPCAHAGNGAMLVLIDDLERILEPDDSSGVHRICVSLPGEHTALRAVLRAFHHAHTDSRLIVTSRFPFSLMDGNTDLAHGLQAIALSEFGTVARRKLRRHQLDAARARTLQSLGDADFVEVRAPWLHDVERLAAGNPGLQDLLGDKLVLNAEVSDSRVRVVLDEMEGFLATGAPPKDEIPHSFLQNLNIDSLLDKANADRELLRATSLFAMPVPSAVIDALAVSLGACRSGCKTWAYLSHAKTSFLTEHLQ